MSDAPSESGSPKRAKDYDVGNCKPPKNRQFGQPEGNPRWESGRPRGKSPTRALANASLLELEELTKRLESGKLNAVDAMAAAEFIRSASLEHQGSGGSASRIFERLDGKVVEVVTDQPVEPPTIHLEENGPEPLIEERQQPDGEEEPQG